MAPIHESDLAENRSREQEWRKYELWERVEERLRRARWLWIGTAVALFLVVSSVPVIADRLPKWRTLAAARRLAREMSLLRVEAAKRGAVRLRFPAAEDTAFIVEGVPDCAFKGAGAEIRRSRLSRPGEGLSMADPEASQEFGVPGLRLEACFDAREGADFSLAGRTVSGFGVFPAADREHARTDRLSIVLLSGPLGEPTFE